MSAHLLDRGSDAIVARAMPGEAPVKALVCAVVADTARAAQQINRLLPEMLCFFAPESSRALIEQQIQSQLVQLPRRWDWVVTPDASDLFASHRALRQQLPSLLLTWGIQPGELVLGLGDATPAMAAALTLAGIDKSSRVVQLVHGGTDKQAEETSGATDGPWRWLQGNLWDEAAGSGRRDACQLFNRGEYQGAAYLFRLLEQRVSGGQKPLYHALVDMAEGYGCWSSFQHRLGWDKLKTAAKSLEIAAVWGGPPGLKALLPLLRSHVGFLERLAMDPQEVKELLTLDLLGHATRLAATRQDPELAMRVLVRALESAAQWALFTRHRIKSWDVAPEQLPEGMRDGCHSRFQDALDGRCKLPLHAQFQVLAERGDDIGKAYLAQWPAMKPLLDAANRAILGHGGEPLNRERVTQFREIVLKVLGIAEQGLPVFPVLDL